MVPGCHLETTNMKLLCPCRLSQHDVQVPRLQRPLYPQRPHLLQAQQHLLGKYQVINRHYKTVRTAFAIQIFIVSGINNNMVKNSIFIDVTRPPVEGNILQNGDFESGSLDPWFCNGCSGSLGTPAHSGEAAFKVDGRHARLTTPAFL